MRRLLSAQGATEYLVLLAVVLVIALVGIALLGFFPGTANDAQVAESQIYWKSASPIAIVELNARVRASSGEIWPYLRIRNIGSYPIRLTGIIGADGNKALQFWSNMGATPNCNPSGVMGNYDIEDYYYLAPSEEDYFAWQTSDGLCDSRVAFSTGATSGYTVGGASTLCQNSSASPGQVLFRSFGFEYIQYVEGQQLVKRQIGAKPLIVKCREPL